MNVNFETYVVEALRILGKLDVDYCITYNINIDQLSRPSLPSPKIEESILRDIAASAVPVRDALVPLQLGLDPMAKTPQGTTVLHTVFAKKAQISTADLKDLDVILAAGVPLADQDNAGRCPLMLFMLNVTLRAHEDPAAQQRARESFALFFSTLLVATPAESPVPAFPEKKTSLREKAYMPICADSATVISTWIADDRTSSIKRLVRRPDRQRGRSFPL